MDTDKLDRVDVRQVPEPFLPDAVPAIPAPEAFRKVFTSEVFRKLPDLAPPEFIIGTLEVLAKEQPVVAAPEAFRNDEGLAEDADNAAADPGPLEVTASIEDAATVVELAAPAAE